MAGSHWPHYSLYSHPHQLRVASSMLSQRITQQRIVPISPYCCATAVTSHPSLVLCIRRHLHLSLTTTLLRYRRASSVTCSPRLETFPPFVFVRPGNACLLRLAKANCLNNSPLGIFFVFRRRHHLPHDHFHVARSRHRIIRRLG